MAVVIPVRGIRYFGSPGTDLSSVLAPPYDVISPAQRQQLHRRDPHNVVRLDLGEELPGDDDDENQYARAGRWLEEWLAAGVLTQDESAALYVYQQAFTDQGGTTRHRTGLVAAVQLQEFAEGGVKPHELTKEAPKRDRLRLLRATRANVSSIFSLCEDPGGAFDAELARVIGAPPLATALGDDGVASSMWRVDEEEAIRAFQEILLPAALFIADGHHRYETALDYRRERRAAATGWSGTEPENFTLMTIVSTENPGLVIFPTHRLLRAPAPIDWERLLTVLSRHFEVSRLEPGEATRVLAHQPSPSFALCAPGHAALVCLADERAVEGMRAPHHSAALNGLDVTILHSVILDRLLEPAGVARAEVGIDYTADANEALQRVWSGEYQLSVLMRPTRREQVLAVAAAGEKMPPKSTYFYPKLITGMVMRRME